LCEVIDLASRGGNHGTHGGEPVQLTVTVDFDKLRAGTGTALLDNGEHIPMAQVRKIACDSGIIPMLLGSRSQIPRPPKHCEAHHVKFWSEGGETNLDNLVLLCRRHHDLVHHSEWQIQMINGVPVFRPPVFVDPQRKPRNNPLHTPPDADDPWKVPQDLRPGERQRDLVTSP
jgi:hypothetical protein